METKDRLTKVEEKLDVMHADLAEIKAGLKFATALVKAIGAIAALVLAYLGVK